MTNQELLQQAKDQVAEKHWKFENWDALEKHFRSEGDAVGYLAYFEIAAKLAIQSAREECIEALRWATDELNSLNDSCVSQDERIFQQVDVIRRTLLTAPGR